MVGAAGISTLIFASCRCDRRFTGHAAKLATLTICRGTQPVQAYTREAAAIQIRPHHEARGDGIVRVPSYGAKNSQKCGRKR